MITEKTMKKVREKLQLPTLKDDRKIAAMGIILDATDDCRDERRGGYNIPRLNVKEARVLVNAIYSEMNRASIAIDRDRMWVNKTQRLQDAFANTHEQLNRLSDFILNAIKLGYLKIPE